MTANDRDSKINYGKSIRFYTIFVSPKISLKRRYRQVICERCVKIGTYVILNGGLEQDFIVLYCANLA